MKNELHEKWEARLTAWEASGQTIRAWCLENGVKNDRMYYWRRKLRRPEGTSQPIASKWLPLEVTDSRVRVLPMDDDVCPLKVCSRRGWIQGPGEVIVCVPNRMVVYMKAERSIATREEDNASVDAVAF
jgi:transposase-like protein